MKKQLFIAAFLVLFVGLFSCKKNQDITQPDNGIKKKSFTISELNLTFSISYEEKDPDNFKLSLPQSFKFLQGDSRFNADQKREYFLVKCQNAASKEIYLISGTCNSDGSSAIAFEPLPE